MSTLPLFPADVPPNDPSTPEPTEPAQPAQLSLQADVPYFLAFERVKGFGPKRLGMLQKHFGSMADAWQAGFHALIGAGLDEKLVNALLSARKTISPEAEWAQVQKAGVTILTWDDPRYPKLLREAPDPPPVLYVRGSLLPEDEWAIGIVGTRKATMYGREVAETLARDLARHHLTVISGMARGVDAFAHLAAIAAGGRTIAVLGCGVDVVYPPEHRRLAEQIVEHGALISDYPLGTKPDAMNFPPRNRIISGMSLGVVVVEADEKSGALITTQFAAEQGREVFAIPGNIFSRASRGPNRLIQQGAKLVLDVEGILEELNLERVAAHIEVQQALPETDLERQVTARLSYEPTQTDDLVRGLQLPADVVTATLALMELKGMVRQATGTSYILAREERVKYNARGSLDHS